MNKEFYQGNREKLYAQMKENALLVLFSGTEVRKTNDEFYPFYTTATFSTSRVSTRRSSR